MFDYADLAATATDVIAEFGQDCIVTVEGEGEYDIETSTVTNSIKKHAGKCVFGGMSEKYIKIFGGVSQGGANLVQAGDVLVTASASCALEVGALLSCNGENWRIVNVMPVKPASVMVAFQAQARKE